MASGSASDKSTHGGSSDVDEAVLNGQNQGQNLNQETPCSRTDISRDGRPIAFMHVACHVKRSFVIALFKIYHWLWQRKNSENRCFCRHFMVNQVLCIIFLQQCYYSNENIRLVYTRKSAHSKAAILVNCMEPNRKLMNKKLKILAAIMRNARSRSYPWTWRQYAVHQQALSFMMGMNYVWNEIIMINLPVIQEQNGGVRQKAPMQWSSSRHAGFSAANNTWMLPADDFRTKNVQVWRAPVIIVCCTTDSHGGHDHSINFRSICLYL